MPYMLALDLKDDQALIQEYELLHQRIWPDIAALIRRHGVDQMEIFRLGTRLVMRMETGADFDPERFAMAMRASSRNREWEALMDRFQAPTPWSREGEKWTPMKKIFDLSLQH